MEATKFVKAIKQQVIESDYSLYQSLLNDTNEAKDPIWKNILPIYRDLSKDQKESFLRFLKLLQINTVSHILGILDGSTYLNESNNLFTLMVEPGVKINGDLQDIFLEMEEE